MGGSLTHCNGGVLSSDRVSMESTAGRKGGRTNSRVPAGIQDIDAAFRRQRLRARHDALGAVDDAPAAGELLELESPGRVDGRSGERHLDGGVETEASEVRDRVTGPSYDNRQLQLTSNSPAVKHALQESHRRKGNSATEASRPDGYGHESLPLTGGPGQKPACVPTAEPR